MRKCATAAFALGCIVWSWTAAGAACPGKAPANALYYITDRAADRGNGLFSGERGCGARRLPRLARGTIAAPVGRATDRACTSETEFLSSVAGTMTAAKSSSILMYIPGYYTSFAQATGDALKLQAGWHFAGPVIVYSWPSKVTSRLTYINDESNATWSMITFKDTLAELRKRFPMARFSFAGHSLGARFAVEAMNALRLSGCSACFGRTAFFAPDVDSDTMLAELAAGGLCAGPPKANPKLSAPVVLYASNKDIALQQSQQLHGHQRAGQAGTELILCRGVDTIDVSYFKSSDRVGHSYQVDTKIANDARAAFAGTPPSKRGLRAVKRGADVYYELR